ncbi:hypothetical protein LR48_Vigan07g229800 [Vigna angularis]|uniref:Uncharacterized protein n=1 Tax=Phaseolus angularis TaxID=3914 RepID=A0A0L9V1G9_PHAAN|nr:hypothetical protein LR48_Vigan07g229800 [Vigna angularis]
MDRNRVGGKFQIHTNQLRKKQMANESGNNAVPGFQWLNRLVSEPYYLFHFLTFFSYFIIRSSASEVLAPHLIQHLLRREIQTLLVFAILVVIKGVKEDNWEAFIADALFLGKICLFVLAITMDRHLAVWYVQQANPIAVGKPVDRGDNYKIVAGAYLQFNEIALCILRKYAVSLVNTVNAQ